MKVPERLAHLRTDRRGIPIPFLNRYGAEDETRYRIAHDPAVGGPALYLDDHGGTPDFFHQHMARQRRCMVEGLCQVCARPVPWSRRWLVVSTISTAVVQIRSLGEAVVIHEPWLDERCARFAVEKCPGLIRRSRADDLHLVPVTSKRDVQIVASLGWVDGPLADESRRVMPAMWVKVHLRASQVTFLHERPAP